MDLLCPNHTFWNASGLWAGDWPELSPCFHDLVLSSGPCLTLWVTSLVYLPWCLRQPALSPLSPLWRTWLFWARLISGCMLLVLYLVGVFSVLGDWDQLPPSPSHLLAACVRTFTMVLAVVLVVMERRVGVARSGPLWIYWLLVSLGDLLPAYNLLLPNPVEGGRQTERVAVFYMTYALQILQLFLHSLSTYSALQSKDSCPESVASFPAWFTYCWINRLMSGGYKEELGDDDVFALCPRDTMLNAGQLLQTNMKYCWRRNGRKGRNTHREAKPALTENTPLLGADHLRYDEDSESSTINTISNNNNNSKNSHTHSNVTHAKTKFQLHIANGRGQRRSGRGAAASSRRTRLDRVLYTAPGTTHSPSLHFSTSLPPRDSSSQGQGQGHTRFPACEVLTRHGSCRGVRQLRLCWSLVKTFWWQTVLSNVLKLPHDCLLILNPLLLGELIRFCNDVTAPTWHGYVIGIAMCASLMTQGILFHLTFHLAMTLGLRVKAALAAAIFRKIVTVASKGRRESSEGEIMNLVSVDAHHIYVFLSFLPYAWSGPLQMTLCIYFLYSLVGSAAFAGAALLLTLLTFNGLLMSRLGILQARLMHHMDQRLRLLTDILTAIKTVKAQVLETALGGRVSRVRDRELVILQQVALVDASQTMMWTLAPFLISLLTFGVYVYTHGAGSLTSEKVFVTLSYLNIMRAVVTVAPMVVTDVVKARVSLKRLERFLSHDDLEPGSVSIIPEQEAAVLLRDVTGCWSLDVGPCVKSVTLSVAEGSLVAVVGDTGAGKSSLLAAILGELHLRHGMVTVKGPVSYVPQLPILRQTSVRANILGWGKRQFDTNKYNATLYACALASDMAALPAGDLTEIGEKGCTLSGGQRQRLCLARAVYESRDLFLLDDPISAVDTRVGRQIVDRLLGPRGMLRDATRVVVTSSYYWLSEADLIVVMDGGAVVEMGSYSDLLTPNGQHQHLKRLLASQLPSAGGGSGQRTLRPQADRVPCPRIVLQEAATGGQGDVGGREKRRARFGKSRNSEVLEGAKGEKSIEPVSDCQISTAPALPVTVAELGGHRTVLRCSAVSLLHPEQNRYEQDAMVSGSGSEVDEVGPEPASSIEGLTEVCPVPRSPTPIVFGPQLANPFLWADSRGRLDNDNPRSDQNDDGTDDLSEGLTTSTETKCGNQLLAVVEHSETPSISHSSATRGRGCQDVQESLGSSALTNLSRHYLPTASCDVTSRGRPHHVLVDEELLQAGKVTWQVYLAVVQALGIAFSGVMIMAYVLYHVTLVGASYWLSFWTDQLATSNLTSYASESNNFYISIYAIFGAAQCACVVTFALLLALRRVRASHDLHAALLHSILASPLSFFHRTPAARLLTRMSRDLEVLDKELWWGFEVVLDSLCQVLSTCVLVCLCSPLYLLALLPLATAYYFLQRYYIPTSRQLRRLESKYRSPVFSHMTDMVGGAPLLRAEGAQAIERCYKMAAGLVDDNNKCLFVSNTASRWLGVRVAAIGVVIVGVATLLGVAWRQGLTGGMLGLTVMFALEVTENLSWLVRMSGDLETDAVSVERIKEFIDLRPEAQQQPCPIWTPHENWPAQGAIHFLNLSASHVPDSPPILRNIDCFIRPREKIGVVGRTGAGKTSLWSVMLGLITSVNGSILIDDVDTRSVPLQELRNRIAVMTQEPLVWEGTVRDNLDPGGMAREQELLDVLGRTALGDIPGGLLAPTTTLSAGQRQLLCLARVLLRHCRVVVLDEATSFLDPKMSDVIWRAILKECQDSTVLFITHRLTPIMHCDRVMVLDQGRLVEMDTAQHLLDDPFSLFSSLAAGCSLK